MSKEFNEQIKVYLKENLSLEKEVAKPGYGMKSTTIIQLKLEDEVISEIYVDGEF